MGPWATHGWVALGGGDGSKALKRNSPIIGVIGK